MKYLLDTCVLSEWMKPNRNERVIQWLDTQDERDLFLSVLTIGELQKGIGKLANGKKRNSIQNWLENELCPRFASRVLPLDENCAFLWGRISAYAEQKGMKLPVIDALLIASALNYDTTFISRDLNHISHLNIAGLRTHNPWE